MRKKIKNLLEWFDNSTVGGVLTLLVLAACFVLFWVSTSSGFEPPRSAQPTFIQKPATLQTQGQVQDGHEYKHLR